MFESTKKKLAAAVTSADELGYTAKFGRAVVSC
jgi:hypothetical protein